VREGLIKKRQYYRSENDSMTSNSKLQSYVDRIENLDATIKEHNTEKSDVYKDAKGEGYDVKFLRKVIAIRRQGPEKHEEEEALVATYLAQLK
jgi:uncharacterized protein (UPF0335 family)